MMAAPAKSCARAGNGGFTLIEVVVAFAILGLALGALFKVFSGGLRNARAGEHYLRAAIVADSALAQVGHTIALEEGRISGNDGAGYHWTIQIEPQDMGFQAASAEPPAQLYSVAVTVEWRDGLADREVSLDTLKIAGPRQ